MAENKIDPLTNMPVVPEGYYWHVSYQDSSYEQNISVCLRKRHWIFFETVASKYEPIVKYVKVDGKETQFKLKPEAYPETILILANLVMEQVEKDLTNDAYWQSIRAANKRYTGNYPPKRLE